MKFRALVSASFNLGVFSSNNETLSTGAGPPISTGDGWTITPRIDGTIFISVNLRGNTAPGGTITVYLARGPSIPAGGAGTGGDTLLVFQSSNQPTDRDLTLCFQDTNRPLGTAVAYYIAIGESAAGNTANLSDFPKGMVLEV